MSQLETGAAPEQAASHYKVQADGGVVYVGAPEAYSEVAAEAASRGLELGSMPAPTGDPDAVTEEKASAKPKANPEGLEKGAEV